jgi:hypothetical protein
VHRNAGQRTEDPPFTSSGSLRRSAAAAPGGAAEDKAADAKAADATAASGRAAAGKGAAGIAAYISGGAGGTVADATAARGPGRGQACGKVFNVTGPAERCSTSESQGRRLSFERRPDDCQKGSRRYGGCRYGGSRQGG